MHLIFAMAPQGGDGSMVSTLIMFGYIRDFLFHDHSSPAKKSERKRCFA